MFTTKTKSPTQIKSTTEIHTLIGEECKISGSISGTGILKMDGTITGDINWDDDIILENSGVCNGNVNCENAVINGKVNGNVSCTGTLTIESYGKITGDISAKGLVIKEGAVFNGKCTMLSSESAEFASA